MFIILGSEKLYNIFGVYHTILNILSISDGLVLFIKGNIYCNDVGMWYLLQY